MLSGARALRALAPLPRHAPRPDMRVMLLALPLALRLLCRRARQRGLLALSWRCRFSAVLEIYRYASRSPGVSTGL